MDRKMVSCAVVGVAIAGCVAAVTASLSTLDTPLYTYRMEQASHKMHFLPTEMNEFIYTTEHGCELTYRAIPYTAEEGGVLASGQPSCAWTCIYSTCEYTCPNTCGTCASTCPYTCRSTCPNTCETCPYTCPYTCFYTCRLSTCSSGTCSETCVGGQC